MVNKKYKWLEKLDEIEHQIGDVLLCVIVIGALLWPFYVWFKGMAE
ncbi:hypothetical protein [Zooshikella harenae]|uniref:TMhelix containing protein n=1 Tax=Zooshikella harenae TaxID=2827238 RepID=A0ABS5ZH73_9GAMM|nr:hypothetical protein [Zooshikella harenae]MBU2712636.1 hypothetical protein [Zooshikella harenae]